MGNWLTRTWKVAKLVQVGMHPERMAQVLYCLRELPSEAHDDAVHLLAAMSWLSRAQDAVAGGGVSYGYSLFSGWLPPYPETTGYCIPTFLAYANHTGEQKYRRRAERMADWELSVQLASGGIPGSWWVPNNSSDPVSFDTGQVIQGWCALYEETQDPRLLDASIRAANWLLKAQRPDGTWEDRAPGRSRPTVFAFNTRTSWVLLDLARITGNDAYRHAALRNLEWTLQQQTSNGWFRSAGFGPNELPLTHTLGYVLEGLLECWERTKYSQLLDAVRRATARVLEAYRNHSFLPAFVNSDGKSRGRSACVTGCAQMARVWLLLGAIDGDPHVSEAGLKLLNQVKTWQILGSQDKEIEGALPGSFPIYGSYEALRFPNWGVKFFCDALLTAMQMESNPTIFTEVSRS